MSDRDQLEQAVSTLGQRKEGNDASTPKDPSPKEDRPGIEGEEPREEGCCAPRHGGSSHQDEPQVML